jgi:hypothetical protein
VVMQNRDGHLHAEGDQRQADQSEACSRCFHPALKVSPAAGPRHWSDVFRSCVTIVAAKPRSQGPPRPLMRDFCRLFGTKRPLNALG